MKNKTINLVRLFALLHVVIGAVLTCIALTPIRLIDISTVITYIIYDYTFPVTAQILFLIYIFAFYDKKPNHILLPISYIMYVCDLGIVLIRNMLPGIKTYLGLHNVVALFRYLFLQVLGEYLVPIAFFVFLIIVCFTKFRLINTARQMVIIYSAISIALLLLNIPRVCELIDVYQKAAASYSTSIVSVYKANIYLYFAGATYLFNIIANFFLWRFALPNKIKENA